MKARIGVLARFAGLQTIVQVLSLVIGLLIVRSLSRDDYAAYSLSVAVATGCGLIAHSGFASTILARGAEVRTDRDSLSRLMATATRYRRRVTSGLVVVGVSALVVMLNRIGVPTGTILGLAFVTGATIALNASLAVFNDLLALEYRRSQMQRIGVLMAIVRLAGQFALSTLRLATAVTTTAIGVLAVALARRMQRRTVMQIVDLRAAPDPSELARVRRSFLQLLPSNTLLVFQGQIVLFLLGLLGHGGSVADLGAVTRFAAVFGLLGAVVSGVLAPMVARAEKQAALRAWVKVCTLTTAVSGAAVAAAFVGTPFLLRLLGDQYSDLGLALRITFVGAALGAVADAASSLNQARGWLRWAWLQLPGTLVVLLLMMSQVDVSDSTGAAWLAASMALPGVVTQVAQFVAGFSADRRQVLSSQETEKVTA